MNSPQLFMFLVRRSSFFFSLNSKLFIFAGQGTQQKGMLSAIGPQKLEAANQIAQKQLQLDFEEINREDSKNIINQTEVTQPLLLLSHYLHFEESYSANLNTEDYMIGHSLGEFSALVNAKSLSFSQGLKLVHQRGLLMKKHTTSPHGMLIIKYKSQKEPLLLQYIKRYELEVACINSRTSIIVAGVKSKINDLSKELKKRQIVSMNLPVSTAFHCKMLENMKEEFNDILQKVNFDTPVCKIIRNYDCKIYSSAKDIREGLLLQLTNPVLFYQSIKTVENAIPYYQIGHKKWISKFVDEIR